LVPLNAAESFNLSDVTIVGMRFYKDSYESLIRAAKIPTHEERFLFLVPEVNNGTDVNAVMLHDGKKKLGSVAAGEAPVLKGLFESWKAERGHDEVVVLTFRNQPNVDSQYMIDNFKRLGSIKVRGLYRVNERLARKFAARFNV